ncbi:MAG: UDP-2,3-diacylglucosamine diphosphatase [Campylobacterota bacterium]|nr:UDP-2,3-diacylglucosamine diphosphatase [Campylobacterota bacterium]
MSSEQLIEIQEGALFIADSHYSHHGDEFFALLQKLESGELKIPQLFLMGDNFDLLFGYNDYIKTFSSEAIDLLQKLSNTLEIYYFEGNHDFLLKEIFTNINVYSREQQPIMFDLNKKKVALSHGDKYAVGFGYDLYCKILRNESTLKLLKPFEKIIINGQMNKLSQKQICHQLDGFEKRVEEIMQHYDHVDKVIEGHYHQAKEIGKYISLPSLACQKKIGVVRNGEVVFVAVNAL